ncbi:MAG TPA: lysophospholipid acyltransferase family protein [Thermoanaerobaculia bacterium]|nr:lysophospholipid acyltransferase family protein [Thermoanaerobaculia bacterium]
MDRGPNALLQRLFFALAVRPVVMVVLGLNVRHRERLPKAGPAVVVANHNSHLDTVVLMSLFPRRLLHRVRPVAAADYFLRGGPLSWFALRVMGIVGVERKAGRGERRRAAEAAADATHDANRDPLAPAAAALQKGDVLVLFPEGTRGEPEQLARFKSGVAHLARRFPAVPVVPVFLHGLGKSLPRGSLLPVPFFCDVFVGEPLHGRADTHGFMDELAQRMAALAGEEHFAPWE